MQDASHSAADRCPTADQCSSGLSSPHCIIDRSVKHVPDDHGSQQDPGPTGDQQPCVDSYTQPQKRKTSYVSSLNVSDLFVCVYWYVYFMLV